MNITKATDQQGTLYLVNKGRKNYIIRPNGAKNPFYTLYSVHETDQNGNIKGFCGRYEAPNAEAVAENI